MKRTTRLNRWRVFICCLSLCCTTSFLSAQTIVIKKTATKSNNYGVTYFLPKTKIVVRVEMTKVTQKAGLYAMYASKYLGINNAIMEDQQYYTLDKISAKSVGIADKDKEYLVVWNSKTIAPFLSLTEEGVICAINAMYEFPAQDADNNPLNESPKKNKISSESLLMEEYFRAGSTTKMAEVLSKQIYKIRESRSDIITGDADNAPRDGTSMRLVLEQLDDQEQALLDLFRGTSSEEKLVRQYEIEPLDDIEKEVIFRFSKHLGIVKADDLSGNPVYLNLTNTDPVASSVSASTKKQSAKKITATKGIVYNVPKQANVEIYYGTTRMFNGMLPVVQFGDTEILTSNLLDDRKSTTKVYFYPETGAIDHIVQTGRKK